MPLPIAEPSRVLRMGGGNAVIRIPVIANFSASDGTLLANYQPDVSPAGSKFVASKLLSSSGNNSIADIQTNKLRFPTEDNGIAIIESGIADCIITCDYIPAASTREYVVARYTSAGNLWCLFLAPELSSVRIREVNNNTVTDRVTTAFTFTNGQTYAVVMTLSGNTISATVGGVDCGSYASATFNATATKHGLGRGVSNDNSRFDNFKVSRP